MNVLHIVVQSKDDPKNLLSTEEKAKDFHAGLTVVFIEAATTGGQMGMELIIKGEDIFGRETIIGFGLTENNAEALMGGLIGARMRFGRMPEDQWEMVRHYVKQQVSRFLETLTQEKRESIEVEMKKFFRV